MFFFRYVAHHSDLIAPDDLMVTADVDAFPMVPDILSRALELTDKKVWIFQYLHTLTTGGTFPMSFIAMKKALWTSIVPERDVGSLSKPLFQPIICTKMDLRQI